MLHLIAVLGDMMSLPAHIIYYDYTTGSLRYATNATGIWNIETVSTDMTYSGEVNNAGTIYIALDTFDIP